ncbi:MAG: M48 family metallopeptidase [Candidatus Omnitrophota bacterium]
MALRLILLIFFIFSISGCATIYNPATGRNEFIFVTTPTEISIGKSVAKQIEKEYTVSEDPKLTSRVEKIGEDIASVSDRKDLEYRFFVIENKDLNAFTTPGGYVYINSGVLDKATDDELACVIGHEVGHVAARHIAKKLQAQMGYDILMAIASKQEGLGEFQRAASISYDLIALGYSREDEMFSDRLGVKYAYKAGYDPYAMMSFLMKMQEEKEENIGVVFLRSHPYVSERIKMLNDEIPGIIEKADGVPEATKKDITINKNTTITSLDKPELRKTRAMCEECRKMFSGSTRYCPYCGVKLQ